jgi:hypothetical protein
MKRIGALLCIVVLIGGARYQAQSISRRFHGAARILAPAIPEPPSNATPTAVGQTDFKPNTAFREYAAQALKVTPAEIEGGAIDAKTAKTMPNSIGNAWAFTMWLKANRKREVRGWAVPDGTVITPEQNLGLLFVEAGVWRKTRNRNHEYEFVNKLAELIVWAYGMNHRVAKEVDILPLLELDAKGDGKLRFISGYMAPKPPGYREVYGFWTYTDNVIALTRDHKATLTKAPYQK